VVKRRQFAVINISLVFLVIFLVFTATGAGAQREQGASAVGRAALSANGLVATVAGDGSITLSTTQTSMIFADVNPLVTVSQCSRCHGANYDNFKNPGLIFKHDSHLARGVRCAACHTEFPHKPGGVNKPTMDTCYSCHGVSHLSEGIVADGSCTKCHPPGFKRLPKNHTVQFKEKSHKEIAKINSFACIACHGAGFCTKCHSVKKVLPSDHGKKSAEKVIWKRQHGKASEQESCSFCHDEKSCSSCHNTPMPHPVFWLGTHKEPGKVMTNDCKTCHEAKKDCSSCHHQFKLSTILVQKECDRCHDDYKASLQQLLKQPKGSRNKGIIVHRAHFEMTKTDPFECSECHDRDYSTAKGCFSFQLCYQCHGRERGGSLVAKWGGQELCYRCHETK
jgi:hypothetical protein